MSTEASKSGGQGFAYDEGKSAYNQASTSTITASGTAEVPPTAGAPVPAAPGAAVTLNDVIVKSAINFVLVVVGAVIGWQVYPSAPWVMWVALIAGFGLAMVNIFKKQVSPPLVMAYAFVQGIFLGGISLFYNELVLQYADYEGLVGQAILGTLIAFGVMLVLYSTNIVRVNNKFMKIMVMALISYAVFSVVSLIAALFGVGNGFGFFGLGWFGVAASGFGVVLATLFLAMDFETIKQGIAMGLPERESWRLSFGLLVTLIWLYLEMLRFIALIALARE